MFSPSYSMDSVMRALDVSCCRICEFLRLPSQECLLSVGKSSSYSLLRSHGRRRSSDVLSRCQLQRFPLYQPGQASRSLPPHASMHARKESDEQKFVLYVSHLTGHCSLHASSAYGTSSFPCVFLHAAQRRVHCCEPSCPRRCSTVAVM